MKLTLIFYLFNCWVLASWACRVRPAVTPAPPGTQDKTVVNLTKGSLRGGYQTSRNGKQYYAFTGVRYAEPPVGPLRFKPPVATLPWSGIKNATEYGPACLQEPNKVIPETSEDCLFLDVFSNDLQGKAPVIVYIHASSMVSGSKHKYGPEYLMDKDIVWVSINYRLGPLGFISTGNSDAPGNYALKDQREALRWVRDNIKAFGGDPDNVSLMGQSAGSMCVTLTAISPSTRGLVHKVIAMSGSGVSLFETDNVRWTNDMAVDLNVYSDNSTSLIEGLRNIPGQDLITAASRLIYPNYGILRWNYQIEDRNSDDPFFTKEPRDLVLEGNFPKIPILVGFTKDEFVGSGSQFLNDAALHKAVDETFIETIPISLHFSHHPYAVPIAAALREYYLPDHKLTAENVRQFGQMISDAKITHGQHLFADRARKFTDVYYYQNNYGGVNARKDENGVPTIGHTGDMHFLLTRLSETIQKDDVDNFMVERLTGWWTHFAATGNPNDPTNSWTNDTNWEKSDANKLIQLQINVTNSIGEEYFRENFELFDRIFDYKKIYECEPELN